MFGIYMHVLPLALRYIYPIYVYPKFNTYTHMCVYHQENIIFLTSTEREKVISQHVHA